MKLRIFLTDKINALYSFILNLSIGAGIFVLLYLVISLISGYGIFG